MPGKPSIGFECTLPPVKITIGFLKCTEVDRSRIINSALQTNVRRACVSAEAVHGGISLGFSKNGWLRSVCARACVLLFSFFVAPVPPKVVAAGVCCYL